MLHTGLFSRDRSVELAHELAGSSVKAVILIGGGEPLMHPSIGTVIAVLHQAGIQLGLVTNGTLIGRYLLYTEGTCELAIRRVRWEC